MQRDESSPTADFQSIFDQRTTPYALVEADPPEFRILAVSDGFAEMTVSRRRDVIGRSIREAFPEGTPDVEPDSAAMFETFAKVIELGRALESEVFRYDIPAADPADEFLQRYWYVHSSPVFDETGERVIQLENRVHDVTDLVLTRQRSEFATPAREDREILLVVGDPEQERRLEKVFGFDWNVQAVAHETDVLEIIERHAPDVVCVVLADFEGGGVSLVREIRERFGEYYPAIVARVPQIDEQMYRQTLDAGADDVIGGPVTFRELVTRTRAAMLAALRQRRISDRSQQQYRELFMNAPVAIALLEGPDLRFTLSNPAHDELAGDRALIGLPVREAFPESALSDIFDEMERVYETGEPYYDAERFVELEIPESNNLWVTFAYLPYRDVSGEIVGVASFTYDVTELVEMRKRAERLAEEARIENERKDEFLALLGHELRNPLAPIVHAAASVAPQRGPIDRDALEKARQIIDRQVRQLTRLVDDLLDISRINRGKIEIRPTHCRFADLAESAVEASAPAIELREQDLEVSLPDEPLTVELDAERITQVLTNLLNNASNYTPEGGDVWLRVRTEGRTLQIEVEDTGRGIPAESLDEIFEPFISKENIDPSYSGGLGLGLALADQLVSLHGGEIEAFSEGPGRGSRFVVTLPEVIVEDSADSDRSETEMTRDGRVRVMLVDDNPDVLSSLEMLLASHASEIRCAGDAASAIELVESYTPDVIFADIGLPDTDGYELARQLRKLPSLEETLLIALTGYGHETARDKTREAGFDRHMTKPADPDELVDILEELSG